MKQNIATLFLIFITTTILFAQEQPILKPEVSVGGKKYTINDGDTLMIDKKPIIVKTSPHMTFDFDNLTFDFPRQFAFQAEGATGYKSYTLDGQGFVITYFVFDVPVEMDVLIKEMVNRFGKKNCVVKAKQSKLGNIPLNGKWIDVTLIGQKLTYDIYNLESSDGKTRMLSFQDSKNEDGSDSAESLDVLQIIDRTIKIK